MTFNDCAIMLSKLVYTTSDVGSKNLYKRFHNSDSWDLIIKEFIYVKAFLAVLVCYDASNSKNVDEVLVIKDLMFQRLKDSFDKDALKLDVNYSELNSRFEHYLKNVQILNHVVREYVDFVGVNSLMSYDYPDTPDNVFFLVKVVESTKQWMADSMDIAQNGNNGGCYVATAVYGSYDCPEVWILRRFRDYILGRNLIGRFFIYVYYKISPTLVKKFGENVWFKKSCKCLLDKFVDSLKNKGLSDSPYFDKKW